MTEVENFLRKDLGDKLGTINIKILLKTTKQLELTVCENQLKWGFANINQFNQNRII